MMGRAVYWSGPGPLTPYQSGQMGSRGGIMLTRKIVAYENRDACGAGHMDHEAYTARPPFYQPPRIYINIKMFY